ncbi:MAG: FG-GAP-like repeat-containing protein [Patescibacteria group bacterium]
MRTFVRTLPALVFGLLLAVWSLPAQALPAHGPDQKARAADTDPNFTVQTTSTVLSATADLTLTFQLPSAIRSGETLNVNTQPAGNCENWSSTCMIQIAKATTFTSATITGTMSRNEEDTIYNYVWINLTADLSAGAHSITFKNVTNPGIIGIQRVNLSSYQSGEQLELSASNSLIYGAPSVQGTILDKNGVGAPDVWVNVWPYDNPNLRGYGTSTGPDGQYAIGGLITGTGYELSIGLPEALRDGNVAPASERFTYSGTTVFKNKTLEAAVKQVTLKVFYAGTTTPVATANAWVSPVSGEGGMGEDVDAITGQAEFFVPKGKTYRLGINPKWDQENQRQITADWIYNDRGLSPTVTFADDSTPETFSYTFEVTKTDTTVTGSVVDSNGVALANQGLDIRNKEGIGNWGQTDKNGKFAIPLPSGSYTINIWTQGDSTNYFTPVNITLAPSQTLDVGTLSMQTKSSWIKGTVVDASGTGVSGVPINAWTINRNPDPSKNVNGWSNTTSLADGSWAIPVFGGDGVRWGVNVDQGRENNNYVQTDTNRQQFEFDVADNQTITGVTLHVKLSDISIFVRLVDTDGNLVSNIWGHSEAYDKTDPYGQSRYWAGINNGTATIRAVSGPSAFEIMAFFPPESGYSIESPQTVDNPVSGQNYNVTLKALKNDAAIQGTLKDDNGKAITGVEAEIYVMDVNFPSWRNGRVDQATGKYRIDLLGGRQYMQGYNLFNSAKYLNTHGEQGTVLTINPGQTYTHDLNITNATASIKLTVLDPNGGRIGFPWLWCDNGPGLEAIGDFKGGRHFNIGGEANSAGEGTLAAASGTWDCSAGLPPDRMSDYIPPDMARLTVTDGANLSAVLQFKKSDGQLTGTVTYADSGQTIKHGGVYAWSPEGPHSWTPVEDGKFSLPLTKGNWFVGSDSMQGTTFYRAVETQITYSGGAQTLNLKLAKESFDVPPSEAFSFDAGVSQRLTFRDGTQLVIESGSLGNSGETVTVTGSPTADLRRMAAKMPVAYGMDFDAVNASNESITKFNTPVTIRIPYLQDVLKDDGIDEKDLGLDFWNESKNSYESADGTQNPDDNYFEAQVDHFTIFSVNSSSGGGAAKVAIQSKTKNLVVTPRAKGGPQIAIWNKDGKMVGSWMAYGPSTRLGVDTEIADLDGNGKEDIIAYPAHDNVVAHVRMFTSAGKLLGQFFPYGNQYRGRIHVRAGDLNGDGKVEIVTTSHKGDKPLLIHDRKGKLISPALGTPKAGLLELEDMDNNGKLEMIVATPDDLSRVSIYNDNRTVRRQINVTGKGWENGIESLHVRDLDGDGKSEIVVSMDKGGNAIRVYSSDGKLNREFNAYTAGSKGGARVSVGNVNGGNDLEIVAFPNETGSAHARIFDRNGKLISTFFAYPANSTKGKFYSLLADVDGNGKDDIVTGGGTDLEPSVKIFDVRGKASKQFMALAKNFRGGVILNEITQ